MKKYHVIVDGSNIAFSHRNDNRKPKLENIEKMITFLKTTSKNFPIEFRIIVDASLRYQIDNKEKLEELEKVGLIIQCPCNHQADDFIIDYARMYPEDTIILSNDKFREYDTNGLVICNFIILFDDVILKPNLNEYIGSLNQRNNLGEVNVCKI